MPARTVFEVPEDYSGTYTLEFKDATFHGLEVVMGRHSFGAIDAAARVHRIDQGAVRRGELNHEDWAALMSALTEFASALVSWNLVDSAGRDVPATLAAIRRLDLIFVMQIFLVWIKALVGTEFEGIDEADLPMETASL